MVIIYSKNTDEMYQLRRFTYYIRGNTAENAKHILTNIILEFLKRHLL